MKYKQAPISEVIFGIIYNNNIFTDNDLLVLNNIFTKEFPLLEICPPLAIEEVKDSKIQQIIHQCQLLYRRRTNDRRWLLQLQNNSIYFNWVRQDFDPVGSYVGYSEIYNRFNTILNQIKEKMPQKELMSNIYLLDLTYQDRFDWQNYIANLNCINQIINIPTIPVVNNSVCNNIFSKFTLDKKNINGFGVINVSTATPINKYYFNIQTAFRGKPFSENLKQWFDLAHDDQNDFFNRLFAEEILNKWKG